MFFVWNITTYFAYVFYDLWDIMTYMLWNVNINSENKRLYKNAYVLRRDFLWITNQNFHNGTNILQLVFDFISYSEVT